MPENAPIPKSFEINAQQPQSIAEVRNSLRKREFSSRGEVMGLVIDLNTRAATETEGGLAFAREAYANYLEGFNTARRIPPESDSDPNVVANFFLDGVARTEAALMSMESSPPVASSGEESEENTGYYL